MRRFRRDSVGRMVALTVAAFVLTAAVTTHATSGQSAPPGASQPAPRPTMTPEQRTQQFQPGPPWTGRGDGSGRLGRTEIDSFAEYPLFWLGESFAGYNLQNVEHVKQDAPLGASPQHPQDVVHVEYGVCTAPSGRDACFVPASVQIRPICAVRPDDVADFVKAGPLEKIRGGAQLQRFGDGYVMIWTGRVSIHLEAMVDRGLIANAINELRGAGTNNGLRAGSNLPAPDFSGCPAHPPRPTGNPFPNGGGPLPMPERPQGP